MEPSASRQELLFQFHGTPPIGTSVSLALQHLAAMIVGCVTPPIIIAGAIGLNQADRVLLIQASLVMSAVSTLLQLFSPSEGGLAPACRSSWVSALPMYPACRPLPPEAAVCPLLPALCW